MFRSKGVLVITVMIALAVLILAPVPSDAATSVYRMESSGVTLVLFSDGIEMNTSQGYPVTLHVYNDNATAVTVKVADGGDSVIKLSLPNSQALVDAGGVSDIGGALTTDKYTSNGDYTVTISMLVMDGVNPPAESTVTVPLKVTSVYSSGERFDRIMGVFDNNLPAPFNTVIVSAAITLLIWIGIAMLVSTAILVFLKAIFKVTEKESDTLGKNTVLGVFFIVILMGINNCLYVLGASEEINDDVNLVSNICYVLFVALVIWDIYKALITGALQKLEKRNVGGGMDTSLIPLFKAIGKIVIILVCIALILSLFGVNFVTLIASAGLTGLGLSFGVKPAINELFSGLIVLMTRPFKVGDYVTVDSDSRLQVVDIGILRTRFQTGYTMETATMPNSKIASSKIVNISHRTDMYRNTITFKVPFDSNLTLIKKIVKRVASEHPNIVIDGSVPKPNAVFSACDDGSAVKMTLAFYVREYDDNATTTAEIREGILREFAERDIKIPYNKMEISIVKGGQTDAQ